MIIKKIILTFFVILVGCQSTNIFDDNKISKLAKNGNSDNLNFNYISNLVNNFKSNSSYHNKANVKKYNPKFKKFSKSNIQHNILLAVKFHPSVLSAVSNINASKMAIETVKSGKETQVNFQGLGGLSRDNETNTLGAVGSVNVSRILYDYGALDSSILSQKKQLEVSRLQAEIAAENIALRSYEVWINLYRQKKVIKIYQEGLRKAEPFLGQIQNISVSGLGDTSMFIKAQQDYSKLKIANSRSSTEFQTALALFQEMFPNSNTDILAEIPTPKVYENERAFKSLLKNSATLKAQNHLISGLNEQLKALQAQKNPNLSINAGVTAPLRNTLKDGTANVGLLVNYIFNDGGRLDSQIKTLIEQIKQAKLQKQSIEKQLKSQLEVALKSFSGAKKTYQVIFDMVELSRKNKKELSAQLETGRSKIQDVLNAEVTLSENRILLANSAAELKIASVRVRALTYGLTKEIGWKP